MTGILVLTSPPQPHPPLLPHLTPAERARCAGFRNPRDAARHATGRVLARLALRRLLGRPVDLTIEPSGRPRPAGCPGAYVSISHAGEVVVAAAAPGPVGIDVEHTGALESLLALPLGARSAFGASELTILEHHPRPATVATRWWTAKEAALKAVGVGLHLPPDALDARGPVLDVPGGGEWRIVDADSHLALPGYHCSLAVPATCAQASPDVEWVHLGSLEGSLDDAERSPARPPVGGPEDDEPTLPDRLPAPRDGDRRGAAG